MNLSKRQMLILKAGFFIALFVVGFIFHDALLGVAK